MDSYKNAELPIVGDEIEADGYRAVVISTDPPMRRIISGPGYVGSEARLYPSSWTLVRRAPSSPAPTPTEGERFASGAVWLMPDDQEGQTLIVGDDGYFWAQDASRVGHGCSKLQSFAKANPRHMLISDNFRTYAGNLSAVFAGLVRLHGPKELSGRAVSVINEQHGRGTPPLVDAEELAARQRAAHKAETERLQERYTAFRASVTDAASEFPAVQVVTDTYRSKSGGPAGFVAWLSCGDLRHEFTVAENDPHWAAKNRARDVLSYFRAELGSRLLKGGGKG